MTTTDSPARCSRMTCFRTTDASGTTSCPCDDPVAMRALMPDDREAEVEAFFERERTERAPRYPLTSR